jgi:hypothetical protein
MELITGELRTGHTSRDTSGSATVMPQGLRFQQGPSFAANNVVKADRKELQLPERKCPVHGRTLERPALGIPSFSWATGYSSLENLAPLKPVIIACPEQGCDRHEVVKD